MAPERLVYDIKITGFNEGQAAKLVDIINNSPEVAGGNIALLPNDFEKKDKKEGERE